MSSATAACHLCARLRRSARLRYLILGAPLACVARKRACRSAAVIALLPNGLGPRLMGSTMRYVTIAYKVVPAGFCVRELSEPRPAALLGSAAQLFVADHCQNCPQLLVVSDRTLVDLANLVEGAVGEFDPVMADRKSAVGVVEDGHVFAARRLGRLARLDDENHFVVLQCQRLGETALLLPGKSVLQIVTGAQRPVQVLLIRRRLGKARIVIGHERRQQGVS